MSGRSARGVGWVLSPRALMLLAAGVAAVVLISVIGAHEQNSRTIPAPTTASVQVVRPPTPPAAAVELGAAAARRIATVVNGLHRLPGGELHCGADTGAQDVLTFRTAHGTITADVHYDGCLAVDVTHGSVWSVTKWDPDGVLRAAIDGALAGR